MNTVLWRTGRGVRVVAIVVVAFSVAALGALWTITVTGPAPVGGAIVAHTLLGGGLCVLMWWTAWLPYVAVTDEHVLIRNMVRRHRVPLRHITAVEPGYNGLELQLAHGTDITAWAVQKTNISRWLGRHTRADDVAAAIVDAARAAGATIASDEGLFWLDSPDPQDF